MAALAHPLFSPEDLAAFLGQNTVEGARAAMVERIVWGTIKPRIKQILDPDDQRPAVLDETVFAIAVQLAGCVYENPNALQETSTAADGTKYTAGRAGELLAELDAYVVDQTDGTDSTTQTPLGDFPDALGWPDPAYGGCRHP